MKIKITINSKPAGYIEYDLVNVHEMMGTLGPINVVPRQLGQAIERRIKNNKDITVSGGTRPRNLSNYFDGITLVLDGLAEEITEFSYEIPEEENPYLREAPEGLERRVY